MSNIVQLCAKYLRQSLVFMRNSALRGKTHFLFFTIFSLVLTKCLFWDKDWALDYNCMKF